ncbi:MAG: hypothetical protein LBT04_05785 [Prevotellaceae bacterium]|jgi:hypothetical protein|nr:hypothetical protein [Prevotellaceae bacterium]
MGRKRLEKASVESINLTMSRMLVPEYILANFDIYGSQEYPDSWVMELREKEGRIPSKLIDFQDVVFDGYCNPIETLSHSFSLKPIYLKVYRRRYKRASEDRHYSNDYDLSLKGVKMVPSMGIFLKAED